MAQFSVLARLSFGVTTILLPCLAFAAPDASIINPPEIAPATNPAAPSSEEQGLAPGDVPIADAIRARMGDALDKIVDDAKQREALRHFYEKRNFAPVLVRADGPTRQFRDAVARLKNAEADGLDPADYPAPDMAAVGVNAEKLAQAEISLWALLMAFARDAQSGRVIPARISPNISVTPPVPEPLQVLETLAHASDAAKALDAFNPPHRGFHALKAKLQELRQSARAGNQPMPGRSRNAASKTIDSIISNMERWRWLPRDLGTAYVLVNVPDYSLDVIGGDRRVFHTRIVVGKKDTPTPIFSDEIETVQVNPTWHVPESLVHSRYLPALSRDPSALRRMGLIVARGRDGKITVRQPPGPRNALGHLKVNFPNPFHVYLHDTPDKHLFKREQRAYSSGCIRVQNPDEFAAHVLSIGSPDAKYTASRLAGMYGTTEQWITLQHRVPVHLVYMNTYVADNERLVVKPDVYGYDARVQSALKGRYMMVKERSQRGSVVARSAPAPRVTAQRPSSRQVDQLSARDGWHMRQSAFGFWGWSPGY